MRPCSTAPGRGLVPAVVLLLAAAWHISSAQAAAPKPLRASVVSVSALPGLVPARGGSVVVSVRVRNARRCTFRGQHVSFASLGLVKTVTCTSGRAAVRFSLAANRYTRSVTIHYQVRAVGADGRVAQKNATLIQAAGTRQPPAPARSPLEIGQLELPSATVATPYTATLVASGGTGPYRWSLAAGTLPAGLALADSGTISGTPTAAGATSFVVQVADASAPAQTASATLSVVVTPPATPPPPGTGLPTATSSNWSGYVLDGGPFTVVQGTFTVPRLEATTTSSSVGEWVGIDGDTPSNATVLQAGVGEDYNPSTNQYRVYAWWESFPAPAQLVPVNIHPGDQVAVRISEVSPGSWLIALRDDTTGQGYSTKQTYTGAATSAEWIVEAPQSAVIGDILTLAHYTGNVTFTGLGVAGTEGPLTRLVMVQRGVPVSEPSDVTPTGFTVAYGSVVPSAP